MSKESGGPAFPIVMDDRNADHTTVEWGMSMRDWFAGMALQGLLANQHSWDSHLERIIKWSFEAADLMLDERNKP